MSDILQYVLTSLISIIGTGGIGSIFYFRQQRKLKDAEVKAAEVDNQSREIANLSASNEEWIKLYTNCLEEKNTLEEHIENEMKEYESKINEVRNSKDELFEKYADCKLECAKKDMYINELNWFRCEVNGCPYRKPPRKFGQLDFPKDGINPIENPNPEIL